MGKIEAYRQAAARLDRLRDAMAMLGEAGGSFSARISERKCSHLGVVLVEVEVVYVSTSGNARELLDAETWALVIDSLGRHGTSILAGAVAAAEERVNRALNEARAEATEFLAAEK